METKGVREIDREISAVGWSRLREVERGKREGCRGIYKMET